MAIIYCITNLINNKKYVGETIYDIKTRWQGHLRTWKNPRPRDTTRPLYRAFTKYGIDNFTVQILEYCNDAERFQREQYWIYELDTVSWHNKGYNLTIGGESGTVTITDEAVLEAYKQCSSVIEIAQMLNCNPDTIYKRFKKLQLPFYTTTRNSSIKWEELKEDLIKEYNLTNITAKELARKINVHESTLRKHLKQWGVTISRKRVISKDIEKEIISLFQNTNSIKQCAKTFHLSDDTIRSVLQQYNIKYDPYKHIAACPVQVTFNNQIYSFISYLDAARWCLKLGLTDANLNSIAINISRVAKHQRASYLGLVWKALK